MLFTVEMWPQGARASSLALRGGCVKPRASGLVRQASRFGARVRVQRLLHFSLGTTWQVC